MEGPAQRRQGPYRPSTSYEEEEIRFLVLNVEATVKWNDPYKLKSQFYQWSEARGSREGWKGALLRLGGLPLVGHQQADEELCVLLCPALRGHGHRGDLRQQRQCLAHAIQHHQHLLHPGHGRSHHRGNGLGAGFLEAICFAILVGLSCDFIVHIAHAYKESKKETRREKTLDAIWAMGPPVLFAAVSTSLAGALLFNCTILFYTKFGAILLFTMAYSFLMIFVFLAPLLVLAGPTGNFGSVYSLFYSKKGEEAEAK